MRFGNYLRGSGYNGCEMVENVWSFGRCPDGGDESLDRGIQVISTGFKESLVGLVSCTWTGSAGKKEDAPP